MFNSIDEETFSIEANSSSLYATSLKPALCWFKLAHSSLDDETISCRIRQKILWRFRMKVRTRWRRKGDFIDFLPKTVFHHEKASRKSLTHTHNFFPQSLLTQFGEHKIFKSTIFTCRLVKMRTCHKNVCSNLNHFHLDVCARLRSLAFYFYMFSPISSRRREHVGARCLWHEKNSRRKYVRRE